MYIVSSVKTTGWKFLKFVTKHSFLCQILSFYNLKFPKKGKIPSISICHICLGPKENKPETVADVQVYIFFSVSSLDTFLASKNIL
jgi:hypothetical protein